MEVGAVKQAFNNEVILMKKNLNQAKIQIIHKLTRKAKTLTEKKLPEKLQEKFKKKAESAVKEVLIIKKIKAKDIAKFIVTHKRELNTYLNKPEVDQDKACARLLLHKSLQARYKSIRSTFGNTSIKDLFMTRLERRKLKKELREKQKNKKKAKQDKNRVVNGDNVWNVEEIDSTRPVNNKIGEEMDDESEIEEENEKISKLESEGETENSGGESDSNNFSESEQRPVNKDGEEVATDDESEIEEEYEKNSKSESDGDIENSCRENESNNFSESEQDEIREDVKSDFKIDKIPKKTCNSSSNIKSGKIKSEEKKEKKKRDLNKNKSLNEKILKRKFNQVSDEKPVQEVKMVDPFFITSTGESYVSLVEPRKPDEIKENHKEGNRKYRRAVMFGHVPPKPRKDMNNKNNNRTGNYSHNKRGFNTDEYHSTDKKFKRNDTGNDEKEKEEKLHPSWAAKKKVSTLLPFEGRKTVFNDDE